MTVPVSATSRLSSGVGSIVSLTNDLATRRRQIRVCESSRSIKPVLCLSRKPIPNPRRTTTNHPDT